IRYYTLKNFLNHLGTSKTGKYEEPVPLDPCGELENTSSSNGNATNGGSRGYSDPNAPTNMNSNSYVNVGYYNYYGGGGSKGTVEVGQGYFGRPSNAQKRNNKSGKTSDTDCPIDEILIPVNILRIINKLTGKAKCIYNKMEDNKNNINWILENFKDGKKPSKFNLKFVMSTTLGDGTNASTATPKQSGIANTFVIRINQNRAENKNTALTIARTIIHEGIHARLWEFMYSRDKKLALIKNDFPGIYEYYKKYEKNWDHQQMAAFYRETIAKGLKQFDSGKHTDEFYDALAWEGLSEIKDKNGNNDIIYSEAWKKEPNKTKILNIIKNHKKNGSKNCN
ncbi:MAG: hypothetical protein V3V28_01330, partial [Polaribacter sp.]